MHITAVEPINWPPVHLIRENKRYGEQLITFNYPTTTNPSHIQCKTCFPSSHLILYHKIVIQRSHLLISSIQMHIIHIIDHEDPLLCLKFPPPHSPLCCCTSNYSHPGYVIWYMIYESRKLINAIPRSCHNQNEFCFKDSSKATIAHQAIIMHLDLPRQMGKCMHYEFIMKFTILREEWILS